MTVFTILQRLLNIGPPIRPSDLIRVNYERVKEIGQEDYDAEQAEAKAELVTWLNNLEWTYNRDRSRERRRQEREKRDEQFSAAEVDAAIHDFVVAECKEGWCLDRRMGESTEDWRRRIRKLRRRVRRVWMANEERIRGSQPRYIEGFPARETVQPPTFRPRLLPKQTGLRQCLQCRTRKLPCSYCTTDADIDADAEAPAEASPTTSEHSSWRDEDLPTHSCQRCVRNGRMCMMLLRNDEPRALYDGLEMPASEETRRELEEQELDALVRAWMKDRPDAVGSRMAYVERDNFAPSQPPPEEPA